jgi:hypothetical protein
MHHRMSIRCQNYDDDGDTATNIDHRITDEKCKYCNKLYKNNKSLQDHIRRVHNNNNYECDQCEV